jgi:hypothetical protein
MPDAKLTRPEAFPANQRTVIILERAGFSTGLTQPESRFDECHHAGVSHGFVIVGGTGSHVGVGVYEEKVIHKNFEF